MAAQLDIGAFFTPSGGTTMRLGGVIVGPCRDSMLIQAPVAAWQTWTGMEFPEDGMYIVPGMLAPLEVYEGVGTHVEPNVWMRHSL